MYEIETVPFERVNNMAITSIKPGDVFARLTTIEIVREDGRKYWKCECTCGKTIKVTPSRLVGDNCRSCGCIVEEAQLKRALKVKTFNFKFGAIREEARAAGLKRFTPLEPCENGHLSERYVGSGSCVTCDSIRKKEYNSKYVETTKAYSKKNKNKLRNRELITKYGITFEEFQALILKQNNKCAICDSELPKGKHTHLDHCHETGKIRGVLCRSCNVGLGFFKDSIELLQKAILYCEQQIPNACEVWESII